MADLVNLRQERKRRRRLAEAAEAADNRLRFGRAAGEKERSRLAKSIEERRIDGYRRDAPGEREP